MITFQKGYTRSKTTQITIKWTFTLIFIAIGIFMFMPFAWMVSSSFKKGMDIFTIPVKWIPSYLFVENYAALITNSFKFQIFFFNSVKITLVNVVLSLTTSALAGFAFAKLRFKFKEFFFLCFLSTMMVPEILLIIPRFAMFKTLGIYNTHFSLFVLGATTSTGTFLMRQFMVTIPDSIIEAATIDGAGKFTIWARIIIPNVRTALISLGTIITIWWWNDYLNPLIFLTNKKLFTIPVGLDFFVGERAVGGADIGPIMAATVIATTPLIIIYFAAQKYITEGLVTTGIKG